MLNYKRSYRGPLKATILDWAGTTVDYGSCAPAGAFVETFRRKGITLTVAQAREPMGLDKKAHIAALLKMDEVSKQWKARFGKASGDEDLNDLYKSFIPIQIECLKDYSTLIPGTLKTAQEFRNRGMKIGTTTGYSSDMIGIVAAEAKKQGFEPDAIVCSSDVKAGRPAPWMALRVAETLGIFPLEAIVKIGDTVADIEEGLNAGMWTIGVSKTGNELGLSEREVHERSLGDLSVLLEKAHRKLATCGAHYVLESIEDIGPTLDDINRRLMQGELP